MQEMALQLQDTILCYLEPFKVRPYASACATVAKRGRVPPSVAEP
jgi:hypothetical protein